MSDERDDRLVSTTPEETAGVERFDRRFEWSPAGRPASIVAYLLGGLPYAIGGVLAVAVLLVSNAAALADVDGVPGLSDPDDLNPFAGDDGDAPDGTPGTPTAAATVTPTPPPGTATPTAGRTPTAAPPPMDSPTATASPTGTPGDVTATNVTATPGNGTLTETAVPTVTPEPTDTPVSTDTPTPTASSTATASPKPTPTPSPTATTDPTATADTPIVPVGSARTRSGAPAQSLWPVLFALSVGVLVRRRRS